MASAILFKSTLSKSANNNTSKYNVLINLVLQLFRKVKKAKRFFVILLLDTLASVNIAVKVVELF